MAKLSNLMQIDQEDLKRYFDLKKSQSEQKHLKQKRVKFSSQDRDGMNLTKYLSCFDFASTNSNFSHTTTNQIEIGRKRFYNLATNITYKQKQMLGCFYFNKFLKENNEYDSKKVQELLFSIPLKKIQLLVSFCFFIYLEDY